MDAPTMTEPRQVAEDTFMLASFIPVPTLGILPANAFLIRGQQPILVDTGVLSLESHYFDALSEIIDPSDIRWLWLTHFDPDHLGCLGRLLDEAPQARVVTNFLGMGKLNLVRPVSPERFYLINPGQALDAGDRRLWAIQPPTYDAPETMALFDAKTRVLLSSDSFGALLSSPAESAADIGYGDLREGIVRWTAVDVPWLSRIGADDLDASLASVVELDPRAVLSSHLPPAPDMITTLAEAVAEARTAQPFVGPDQAALTRMLAMMGEQPGASP